MQSRVLSLVEGTVRLSSKGESDPISTFSKGDPKCTDLNVFPRHFRAIVKARHLRFRGLPQVAHLVASQDTRKLLTVAGAVPPPMSGIMINSSTVTSESST
jgi:hypothetical protein